VAAAVIIMVGALALRLEIRHDPGEQMPAVANATWIVPGRAIGGGQPRDLDLLNLRDLFAVDGVVNLRSTGAIEGWMVRDDRMAYLWLPVDPGEAPTIGQLRRLAAFVDRQTEAGAVVFIHDDDGLDRVPVAAVMLQMWHGAPVDEALKTTVGVGDLSRTLFSDQQRRAIEQLGMFLDRSPRST
jgi:hypothetical protein